MTSSEQWALPITGRTRVLGLIGHPVRHSLSPELHTSLFRRYGIDALYLGFDVDPDHSEGVADAIRTLGLTGVNLTAPFKEKVMPSMDRLTIAAEEAGAVNVVTNVDGFLTGYNTDGAGLMGALAEALDWTPGGKRCLVLGAGGSGRAIAASFGAAGAKRVTILNRTAQRAATARDHLARRMPEVEWRQGMLDAATFEASAPEVDLVVNCLGAGAENLVRSFPVASFPRSSVLCDINYWMDSPPLLDDARAVGMRTLGGIGMLLHQGALSFELFTGQSVTVEELRGILGEDRERHLRGHGATTET